MFTMGPPLWAGANSDPYFANVVLLMHLNGDLIDVKGHPFSTVGGSFVTDGPFGTQARDIGGDSPSGGGGNCLYSTSPSTDWWMDDGDFSIEITAMRDMTSAGRPRMFIRLAEGTTGRDYLDIGMSDSTLPINVQVRTGLASTETLASSFTPASGAWHRYHFRRSGDTHTLHVDGAEVLNFVRTYRAASAGINVYIGNNTPGFVDGLKGRIKEVRITKGVARPIQAQTAPFPDF